MIKLIDSNFGYQKTLIAIALLSGFILTLIGLENLSYLDTVHWKDAVSVTYFLFFLVVVAILLGLLTLKLNKSASLATLILGALLIVVSGAIGPLLVTIWFVSASSMQGYWLLVKLKVKPTIWLNCFLIGSGAYGSVVGLLAHFPINYPGVYAVGLVLPFLLNWRLTKEAGKYFFEYIIENCGSKHERIEYRINWLDIAIGSVSLVYIAFALMPEIGFDALVTHLFVPAHMVLRHLWGFDVNTYVWAVEPMLGPWIFSIGYMLGGETAARLINVVFVFVLGRLAKDCALWVGGSAQGARWAELIFLSTPLTFIVGCSLYAESIWSSFVVAGSLAVLRACSASCRSGSELPVAGVLLGFGVAAKAVALTTIPGLLLLLIWRYKIWFNPASLPFLVHGLGLFLAIGIIPYTVAWWITGNPVFPFFNLVFQSPNFPGDENWHDNAYRSGVGWDIIYRITFHSANYLEANAGAPGFQWMLLFIPAAIALIIFRQRDRETERQRDRETERQRDRETERQRDRETERQRDRETERQRDRETERQRDRETESYEV